MKNLMKSTMVLIIMVAAMSFASFAYTPAEEAAKAVQLINDYRVANGLKVLTWDDAMSAGTITRANEISVLFEHTRPNGLPWYTVDTEHFYGENLAKGFENSADSVVKAWIASPVHRENILGDFSSCNLQVCVGPDGKWYWANEFNY